MVKRHRVRAHHRPPRPVGVWLIAAICLGIWGAYLPAAFRHLSPYSDDGASYIEASHSLLAGRGLQVRTYDGLDPQLWQSLTLWPPGFPLALAALQRAGLSEPHSWIVAPAGSMAASLVLVVWIASRFFTPAVSLAIALATALMPAFMTATVLVMSDPLYLAVATGSIAYLIAWTLRPGPVAMWLVAAGLLAGLAWGIRYAAVALWTATAAWLLAHLLWTPWRQTLRNGFTWGAGLLLGAGPFMVRNLLTAGRITPYDMPPSELSVWDNVRITAHAIVSDLFAWQTGADWLFRRVPLPILLAAAAAAIGWLWLRPVSIRQARASLQRHRAPLLLALYLVTHLAVLIAARAKYHWGAMVDARVILPVYWILWMGLAAAILTAATRLRLGQRAGRVAVLAVFTALIGLQARDWQDQLQFLRTTISGASPQVIPYAFGSEVVRALKEEIGPNQIVLSTRAFVLRIHANLNARQLLPAAKVDPSSLLTLDQLRQAGRSGLLWGIILDDLKRTRRGDFGALIQEMAEHPDRFPEFQQVHPESPALILRYTGSTT